MLCRCKATRVGQSVQEIAENSELQNMHANVTVNEAETPLPDESASGATAAFSLSAAVLILVPLAYFA